MNKTTIKAFIAWLEQATESRILERRAEFLDALGKVSSREAKADLRLGLRLIDEELLARLEMGRMKRQPR